MTPVREALERFAQAIEYGEPKTHMTAMGDRKSRTVTMSFPEEKCDMLIRQLRALSAEPGEPCAVKPLEWRDLTVGNEEFYIASWGDYEINRDDTCSWPYILRPFIAGQSNFQTLDEAKAAAQADYEQRIRSALVTTPQPAAGWDIADLTSKIEAAQNLFYEIKGDFTDPRSECREGANLLADVLESLRREAPAPTEGKERA